MFIVRDKGYPNLNKKSPHFAVNVGECRDSGLSTDVTVEGLASNKTFMSPPSKVQETL